MNAQKIIRKSVVVCTLVVGAASLTNCAKQPPDELGPMGSCIVVPQTSSETERSGALKLKAALIGSVGTPELETNFKNATKSSFATLSQNTLDQLVVIRFLVCLKTHHSKDLSPATVAELERSLQVAIAKAAGARSYAGPLSQDVKAEVLASPLGKEKLAAIQSAGL